MSDVAIATNAHQAVKPKVLPRPNNDFYQIFQLLNDQEQEKVKQGRDFMETAVAPMINKYWAEDALPFELLPGIRELGLVVPRLVGKGRALQLILSGSVIGAQEAHRIGLVNEVVPASELITRAKALLYQIASNAPLAV